MLAGTRFSILMLLAATLAGAAHAQSGDRSPALQTAIAECEDGAMRGRDMSRALGACDFALDSDSIDDVERGLLLTNRAAMSAARGAAADARADLESAAELVADFPELHLNWSAVLIHEGSYADAVRAADNALDLGLENEAHAHFNRAIALERMDRPDEAYAAYVEAARLSPDDSRMAEQPTRFARHGRSG